MPCLDYRPSPGEERAQQMASSAEAREAAMQRRLDAVVDLLCQWGRAHDRGEPMPPIVRMFLDEHRRWDEKRGQPWA